MNTRTLGWVIGSFLLGGGALGAGCGGGGSVSFDNGGTTGTGGAIATSTASGSGAMTTVTGAGGGATTGTTTTTGSAMATSSSTSSASTSSSSGGVCAPAPGDTACTQCTKTSCCTDTTACLGDTNCSCWALLPRPEPRQRQPPVQHHLQGRGRDDGHAERLHLQQLQRRPQRDQHDLLVVELQPGRRLRDRARRHRVRDLQQDELLLRRHRLRRRQQVPVLGQLHRHGRQPAELRRAVRPDRRRHGGALPVRGDVVVPGRVRGAVRATVEMGRPSLAAITAPA